MSLDDFCRCTPNEFYEAYCKWAERQRDIERSAWERTRILALFAVQPFAKKSLKAHELLPLPWDNIKKQESGEQISKDELNRRFNEAKKKYGLK